MPFGKANSSRVFCRWTSTWCESFKCHFQDHYCIRVLLLVYMDDLFGGLIRTESLAKDLEMAKILFRDLIEIGAVTISHMNLKKCEGPARSMDISALNFNSVKKTCFLAKSKVSKYRARLLNLRKSGWASSKEL